MDKRAFARRERDKAKAYVPEQVPGRGRFGKPVPGTDYLPEKEDYVEALGEFIADPAKGPGWQITRLGYVVDAGPGFQIPEPESMPAREGERRIGHPATFMAWHTY